MSRRLLLATLVLLLTPAALAEKGDWFAIGGAQWIAKTGENRVRDLQTGSILDADLDAGGGIYGGVQYFFRDRLSMELSAGVALLSGQARIRQGDAVGILLLGDIEVIPLTALLQYHIPLSDRFTWYVGGGGAYIFFGDFEVDLPEGQRLRDDSGAVVNTGFIWSLGSRWGIFADGKYIPFETGSGFAEGQRGFRFEPIFAAAGVRYRF